MASMMVVCRKASEPTVPGHETGYFCRSCGQELQVSVEGRMQIAAGGEPYCNPCGFTLAHRMKAKGADVRQVLNRQAARQVMERLAAGIKFRTCRVWGSAENVAASTAFCPGCGAPYPAEQAKEQER